MDCGFAYFESDKVSCRILTGDRSDYNSFNNPAKVEITEHEAKLEAGKNGGKSAVLKLPHYSVAELELKCTNRI